MVLDTTGSMASSGKRQIAALFRGDRPREHSLGRQQLSGQAFKIGLVPFAMTVRLDPTAAVSGGWIDTAARPPMPSSISRGKHAWLMGCTDAGGLSGTSWLGCVEARPNRQTKRTARRGGAADSKWVAWFQPAEPNINDPKTPRYPYVTDVVNSNQSGITSNFSSKYIVILNTYVCSGGLDGELDQHQYGGTALDLNRSRSLSTVRRGPRDGLEHRDFADATFLLHALIG
ncbi:MAG: hypothetical protein U1E87_00485 [Alphaproteobacteria bacterium]